MEKTLTQALRAARALLDRAEAAGLIAPFEAQARRADLGRLARLDSRVTDEARPAEMPHSFPAPLAGLKLVEDE